MHMARQTDVTTPLHPCSEVYKAAALLDRFVLVMDSCVGVVAAAVVERLGGMGAVCCAYVDKPVSLAAAQCLNLSPAQSSTLSSAALHMLSQLKALPLASPEQANSANAPGPSSCSAPGAAGKLAEALPGAAQPHPPHHVVCWHRGLPALGHQASCPRHRTWRWRQHCHCGSQRQ
ncbi:hypothetical protein V8C86DRAFT_1354575 [Haematococcus lacustris]